MDALKNWKISCISNDVELNAAVERMMLEEILSVDTETVGWETGNDKLALVQFGLPKHKEVLLIDAFKKDISVLEKVLSRSSISKIAHNAAFEDRQFKKVGIKMEGVIDTMKLSRALRPDLPSHSLKTCCKYLLNIEISKEEQTSRWDARPLSQSQLDYAAMDAIVTWDLYQAFMVLQDKITINPDENVEILMKRLAEVLKKRWDLTKDISSELAFCTVQEEIIKESIKTRLKLGDPAYKGEFGSCSIKKVKTTEVNVDKVKELFPEVAPLAIKETVERKRLKELLPEYGFTEDDIEQVLDVTGFNERLELSVDYSTLTEG